MVKSIADKMLGLVSCLAITVAICSVSQICFWFYHQPDVPEGLAKYEK